VFINKVHVGCATQSLVSEFAQWAIVGSDLFDEIFKRGFTRISPKNDAAEGWSPVLH